MYVPEILPLEARTKGTAIGISSNWTWNFVVVMITPVIINRLKWKAYLIFTATNLLMVPTICYFYPETSNLGLEDIDYIFSVGGNPVDVARTMQKELGPQSDFARRASVVSGANTREEKKEDPYALGIEKV